MTGGVAALAGGSTLRSRRRTRLAVGSTRLRPRSSAVRIRGRGAAPAAIPRGRRCPGEVRSSHRRPVAEHRRRHTVVAVAHRTKQPQIQRTRQIRHEKRGAEQYGEDREGGGGVAGDAEEVGLDE
ncbi:hypothetical protein D1007_42222 [Hordeum vulgare]|nr:hypothetical protein D1007_42222 [Hordeum vulgare]